MVGVKIARAFDASSDEVHLGQLACRFIAYQDVRKLRRPRPGADRPRRIANDVSEAVPWSRELVHRG